mgnify:CR=1 FL=1
MHEEPDLYAFTIAAEMILHLLGLDDRPVFVDARDTLHAYPVPDGTVSTGHGRTGGHAYLNLDGVVAAGMVLAKSLRMVYRLGN